MEAEHLGKIALLHDGDVVGVYEDRESAYSAGVTKYGPGAFSFEEIGARPLFVSFPTNFDILLGMDFLDIFEITLNDRACTFKRN